MDDVNKRMNFFDRQFLRASDFQAEQSYHLDRRTRHNRLLHTPGVAEGLEVQGDVASTTVTVKPGTALDALGREIVLLQQLTLNLPAGAAQVAVYVSYTETPDTPSADPGVTGNTRVTESPAFAQVPPDAQPANGVLLAKLSLNNGQLTAQPDNTVRSRAGTIIGDDLAVRSLTLKSTTAPPNQWPKLSCSQANLLITGGGNVGIGTSTPTGHMLDVASSAGASGNSAVRALFPGGGGLAGTEFAALAHRDGEWKAVYAKAGSGGAIALYTDGEVDLMNGNVGVGTAAPARRLQIGSDVSGIGLDPSDATPNAGYIRFGDSTGWKLHFGRSRESSGGALNGSITGVLMTLQDNGNFGIGTTNPQTRLQIKTLTSINEGPTASGAWANFGSNAFFDGVWKRIDATKAAVNMHMNGEDSAGQEFRFFRMEADGSKARNLAVLGSQTSYIAESNLGIGTVAPGFKLDVADRIRLRQGPSGTAGIWLFQSVANRDQAFIGMFNDNLVGFWGTTMAAWGLVMDTTTGNVSVRGSIAAGGGKGGYIMDQFVNNLGDTLEQGDVVIISGNQPSHRYGVNDNIPVPEVDLAQQFGDTRVCGIVGEVYGELRSTPDEELAFDPNAPKPKKGKAAKSGEGLHALHRHAFTTEEMTSRDSTKVEKGQIGWMVTLGAFAHCKVDADIAPIKAGDLLTTSPTKGHAQKVTDPSKAAGTILGKALASLKKGRGKIPVMVMLQ